MKVESSTTRTRRRGGAGGKAALHAASRRDIRAAVDRISTERPFAVPRAAIRGCWPVVGRIRLARWSRCAARRSPPGRAARRPAAARWRPRCRARRATAIASLRSPGQIRPPYSIAPSTPAGAPAGRMTDWRGGRTRAPRRRGPAHRSGSSDTQRKRWRLVSRAGAVSAVLGNWAARARASPAGSKLPDRAGSDGRAKDLPAGAAGRGSRAHQQDEAGAADRQHDVAARRRLARAAQQPVEAEGEQRLAAQHRDAAQRPRHGRQRREGGLVGDSRTDCDGRP